MTPHTAVCFPQDSLATAAGTMWERDIGALPVVNAARQVVAMITDRDICMAAYMRAKPLPDISVSEAMSREIFFTSVDASIAEAEQLMRMHRVRRLPVLDAEGILVGIISLKDLAQEAENEIPLKEHEVTVQEVLDTLAAVSIPRFSGTPPH
jgi:CBS domain-containing protein